MKIAIMNQKGGATKTETAKTILVELAKLMTVKGVDADAQGNLAKFFKCHTGKSIMNIIRNESTLDEITSKLSDNLSLVQSAINLAALDIEISSRFGAETKLMEILEDAAKDSNITVYDCPPAINRLTAAIIAKVDYIIIPVTPSSIDAIDGYSELISSIEDIVRVVRCDPKKVKVLISRYNEHHIADRENLQKLIGMDVPMFKTFIRESTAVSRARNKHQTIIQYNPQNNVAVDFKNLINELIQELNLEV